jgi:xanthine dehydrogenase small subunit
MRNEIVFYINGKRHQIADHRASMMLAEYLRYDQCLTGTKVVCAEGDCGACSVLRYFPADQHKIEGKNYSPINSCVTPVATLDGSSLITVEALGNADNLSEVQRSMVENHGSQCGFCTPGFIMAMTGLVEKKLANKQTEISEQEAKNALTGNLCRCTGYNAIIDSTTGIDLNKCSSLKESYYSTGHETDLMNAFKQAVHLKTKEFEFFAPKTIIEACDYLEKHPNAKIIASSTDLGVVTNKRKMKLQNLLSLHLIDELYAVSEEFGDIKIGARVSITDFRHHMKDVYPEIAKYLDIFASPQIKNIATVVGNVANASPIGDTPPVLLALGAKIHLHDVNGERVIELADFFLDYRKTALKPGELITAISFPINKELFFKAYKYSNRKDLDISAVNFAICLNRQNHDIKIAAGGVAATPLRLKATEKYLKQYGIKKETMDKACEILQTEFTPISDVRASAAYRRVVIENYFRESMKAFMEVNP